MRVSPFSLRLDRMMLIVLSGYETVAGLGKAGYNIGGGIGGALAGQSGKDEEAKDGTS